MLGLHGISLPPSLALWARAQSPFSRLRKPELNKNRPPARNRSVPVLRLKTTEDKIFTPAREPFPVALYPSGPLPERAALRAPSGRLPRILRFYVRTLSSPWLTDGHLSCAAICPSNAENPITPSNPNGDFLYGLGDALAQAALIKTLNERWAAGAAVRIVAPTGAEGLTGGKWQALPMVGARVMLPELSEGSFFTGLLRYDVSFAGSVSSRNINNLANRADTKYHAPPGIGSSLLSRSGHPFQLRRSGNRADRRVACFLPIFWSVAM